MIVSGCHCTQPGLRYSFAGNGPLPAQATARQLSPLEFLALLLDDELERRGHQWLAQQLKLSGCAAKKTLTAFDFSAAPGLNRGFIHDLAGGDFIRRHENLLLTGPSGVGKSHPAIAIEALKRDQRLLTDLHAARSSGAYPRLMTKILAVELLVLDDFGLQPLSAQAAQDLYDIIWERYEAGSLIITSHRAFTERPEVFGNELLASAALDRLPHHCHKLNIKGESFRLKEKRRAGLLGQPKVKADGEPEAPMTD